MESHIQSAVSLNHYAVKVVLTTTDASLVPKVRNLRVIATPEG